MGSPTDARPSGSLVGRIRIRRALSQGFEGIVYEADDPEHGFVLLKELYPGRVVTRRENGVVAARDGLGATWSQAHERFRIVGRRLRSVADVGVVNLHEVLSISGTSFWVMEKVSGPTLAERLAGGRLSPDEANQLANQLSRVLDVLHRKDITHLDINPDSLILREGGTPVLVGFGAARDAIAEAPGEPPVSPGFTPPELYGAGTQPGGGARSDIYAASAVLWWAITGEAPPAAPNRTEGDLLWSANIKILPGVKRGLRLEPAERPVDISEWRIDLGLEKRPPKVRRNDKTEEKAGAGGGGDELTGGNSGDSNIGRHKPDSTGGNGIEPPSEPPSKKSWLPWVLGVLVLCLPVLYAFFDWSDTPVPKNVQDEVTWSMAELETNCTVPVAQIADLEIPATVKFLDATVNPDTVIASCDDAVAKVLTDTDRARFQTASLAAQTAKAFAEKPDGQPDLSAIRLALEGPALSQEPMANYLLGLFYMRGWGGLKADDRRGYDLIGQAQAVPQAKVRMGELLREGVSGVGGPNIPGALQIFSQMSDQSPVAKAEYARLLLDTSMDEAIRTDAWAKLDEAFAAGVPVAALHKARALAAGAVPDLEGALAEAQRAIDAQVGEPAAVLKLEMHRKLGDRERLAGDSEEDGSRKKSRYLTALEHYQQCSSVDDCGAAAGYMQGNLERLDGDVATDMSVRRSHYLKAQVHYQACTAVEGCAEWVAAIDRWVEGNPE